MGATLRRIGMMMAFLLVATAVRAEKTAQKVTLSFKNAKIEQVFSEISKQTDYRFFYSDEVTRKATPVSITVKDVDVLDLLNELMHGQSMKYKVIAGTIIINLANHPDKMDMPPVLSQQIIVTHINEDSIDVRLPQTVGLTKIVRKDYIVPGKPDQYLDNMPPVEEPGGS